MSRASQKPVIVLMCMCAHAQKHINTNVKCVAGGGVIIQIMHLLWGCPFTVNWQIITSIYHEQ